MHDTMPRYAPEKVMTLKGMQPVIGARTYPPNTHPTSPIKDEFTALELITPVGSRWYGCDSAYINSELRIIVIGFDSRDEVRSKWEVCKTA